MSLSRTLYLYRALFVAGLKSKLNYRADTVVMAISSLLTQGIGYIFLWVVFQRMPTVAGWTLPELICVYATVFITEGFVMLFCEGLWALSWIRHRGDFDAILVRPVSPLLQVMLSSVGPNGIATIGLGAAMIWHALPQIEVEWTVWRIVAAVGLLLSAAVVRMSTVLASSAVGFWVESPYNPALPLVHSVSNFARFPLTIYGRVLHLFLIFVVPFAFVSYYPVAFVLGKESIGWIGLFTPLVALVCLFAGTALFRYGLRRYEGAGS
jgi:ABC-2 type transport system permease protein